MEMFRKLLNKKNKSENKSETISEQKMSPSNSTIELEHEHIIECIIKRLKDNFDYSKFRENTSLNCYTYSFDDDYSIFVNYFTIGCFFTISLNQNQLNVKPSLKGELYHLFKEKIKLREKMELEKEIKDFKTKYCN